MDFGFGDEVYPSPNIIEYPNLLENMPSAKINTYPLESVIAEKFQCLIDLAGRNTRMKDYFVNNPTLNKLWALFLKKIKWNEDL